MTEPNTRSFSPGEEGSAQLEHIVSQFENAWNSGKPPCIDDYLSSAGSNRTRVLVELIFADLECRLRAGEVVRVEAYFERYPQMVEDPSTALDLIATEHRFRRRTEPDLDEAEFFRRFPQLRDGLAERLTPRTAHQWTTQAVAVRPTDPVVDPSLPEIPGYEIQDILGRGGMGVVYKARHLQLNRLVALKMILGGHPGPEAMARFQAEAQAVARLQHPGIVQIYETNEHNGQPYIALEFVDGRSLDKHLAGQPLAPQGAAELMLPLVEAVHAAHQKGIIHRDLKPANVLLTADRRPKVTDFGLAKYLDQEQGQTRTGAIMGTPSYMAPEQAEGRSKEMGPATDVYALGAILYEALTGRPPFRGATALDTLEQVRSQVPVPPSELQPRVPRDLELICLKCLEKHLHYRYANAALLADDLRHFLAGEAISLRPLGMGDRLVRTLGQSRLRTEFREWGNLLLVAAAVILVAHGILDYLYQTRQPFPWIVGTDCAQFTAIGVAVVVAASRRRSPIHAEEHQLCLLAVAYLMGCALVRVIDQQGAGQEAIYGRLDYPYWSVLAALLWFMLGGTYWGRCYLFSAAFGVLAMLSALYPSVAVIGFGTTWSACLCSLGLHLRRLGSEPATRQADPISGGPSL